MIGGVGLALSLSEWVLSAKSWLAGSSTTLAVWSGTGLNEAASAAVKRSLEVEKKVADVLAFAGEHKHDNDPPALRRSATE